MKHLKTQIVSLLILLSFLCQAQKQANIWYFGDEAGLDFNSGTPIALTNGQLVTQEGCASIADANGNLLFYTDGTTVWNKNHQTMTNGVGLLGNNSSTQSAIIIPKPNSNSIYYIFTVDVQGGANGLNYSEIDMGLSNGLGSITTNKNIQLITPTCEKITAVLHSNKTDIWVISHEWGNNAFHAYLVTQNGVNTNAVISNSGSSFSSGNYLNTIGYMKASPDGKFVALANKYHETMLFEFDNNNGVIDNFTPLPKTHPGIPYGIEFSPSSKLLYIASPEIAQNKGHIYQYDLKASNINSSRTLVKTILGSEISALQLGPDKKIYIAQYKSTFLGIINKPNNIGINCDIVSNAVSLNGKECRLGLPPFIQSYFHAPTFDAEYFCLADQTSFICTDEDMDQISWDFGDASSGANNNASGENAIHMFTAPGEYTVTMTTIKNGVTSTGTQQITIFQSPHINLEETISLCVGESIILDATNNNASYLWNDNSTDASLKVTNAGPYSVTVTSDNGCENTKNIDIISTDCADKIVYLPTAFSPNGDGINDQLFVRGEGIEALELSIYNRFGELVFMTKDKSIGWDGYYNGEKLNSEVYITNLNVTFTDGEEKQLYGNVTLLL